MSAEVKAPLWLIARADQRLAMADERIGFLLESAANPYTLVIMQLTDPPGDSLVEMQRWSQTCDHCGTYEPDVRKFWTGALMQKHKGAQVQITYGVCAKCHADFDSA